MNYNLHSNGRANPSTVHAGYQATLGQSCCSNPLFWKLVAGFRKPALKCHIFQFCSWFSDVDIVTLPPRPHSFHNHNRNTLNFSGRTGWQQTQGYFEVKIHG
ncbi:hypothetical protein E2C01_051169 [Portunus trituberculatus]|uniref:Uncharacterized protein n=1 Tax=Portunus trituberculatus TaxID=210409 RepID=A0A5B7GL13_PORTR|nr:hypothetical protein [Portunus trituberculatus]